MTQMNRRQFGLAAAAAAGVLAMPSILRAQARPRLVVIGGGAGGATVARYVAKDSKGAVDVTLVEANPRYTTCFFSNLYLGGFRDFGSITFDYGRLAEAGVKLVTGMAETVDRDGKAVVMADGSRLPYDRLVVAPGIDLVYGSVPGYSAAAAEVAPHAWKAGPQTMLLKERLDAVRNGETIVMVAPPNPYRCPPGPYERASMMAHVLKGKGYADARIIILDPKPKFSKQALFQEGWAQHYPGMIEWYGPDVHGGIEAVDPQAGTVQTGLDTFRGVLLNIIPAQRAGGIAQAAGLTDDSGFCPIDAGSMRSTKDPAIFVVGDSSIAGDMPKSGFSANSQAKVAAMAVRGDLTDARTFPARYSNTCWSLIDTDDGVKVGATYEPKDGRIASTSSFISQTGEDSGLRKATYDESLGWYAGITTDIFG